MNLAALWKLPVIFVYENNHYAISTAVETSTAIVNPPETCILAVGRIADRAVVVDGQIVARPMMNLCLSYDHRVIDGAPSARFLQCVKHYIENPVWLLV